MNTGFIQRIRFTGPLALAIASLPFSMIVCHLSLALFGISWMVEGRWKEKWQAILENQMVAIFFFFFLLHLLGIIYSEDKHAGWFNLEKKISLFALPMMLASIKLEKSDVRKLLHVFIIACLVATTTCLIMAFYKIQQALPPFNFDAYTNDSFYSHNSNVGSMWAFISYIELASGIGIHPVYLSLYVSFCVLLIFHFYSSSFTSLSPLKKVTLIVILLYLEVFVLFLSSRIMIFALLLVSFYGIYQLLKTSSRLVYVACSFLFVCLFSGILYLNPISRFRSYQEMISTWPYEIKPGLQKQSTTVRASLWLLSIQSLPKINWLLGIGTGDVEHLIAETGEKAHITNVLGTSDPHNQYLQTLLGLGLLGLCSLLICFAWPVLVSYQSGNILYVGFMFLFSVLCLTETAMELQKGIVFYTLIGSLILFQYKNLSPYHLSTLPIRG